MENVVINNCDLFDSDDPIENFFADGGSVRMLYDLSQPDMDTLFCFAKSRLEAGDYAEATRIINVLALLDTWNFEYWLALGVCHQNMGNHRAAIACFSRSGVLIVDDPRSAYLAALSYQIMGDTEKSTDAFRAAIAWCDMKPGYEDLHAKALDFVGSLEENC